MKNKNLGDRLYSLLLESMGPSEKALSSRKTLTQKGKLTLSLDNQDYDVVLSGQIARIQLKNITCEVPFVPWGGVDELVEKAIKGNVDYSRDIGVVHRLRFSKEHWN